MGRDKRCLFGPRQVENRWRATLCASSAKLGDNFHTQQSSNEAADIERRRAASSLAVLLKSARLQQSRSAEIERGLLRESARQEIAANKQRMQQMRKQRMDELAWRRENALECRRCH